MDLKKKLKLQELKKRYGYDIAVLKQSDTPVTEEELFKSLLLFHTQNTITEAINEYAEAVEGSSEELSTLVTVLFNTTGEIIGNIARQDLAYVVLCKQIALRQFDLHLKDFFNGKSGPTHS